MAVITESTVTGLCGGGDQSTVTGLCGGGDHGVHCNRSV